MDRSLSARSFAFLFAGCFLGAGFLSGKELWQFFGVFGREGTAGLFLSLALLFSFCAIFLLRAHRLGEASPAALFCGEQPALRRVLGVLQAMSLFCVYLVMVAGAAAVLYEAAALPKALSCAVFCALGAVFAVRGAGAVLRVLCFCVPLLLLASFLIFVRFLRAGDLFSLQLSPEASENPVLRSSFLCALLYASFNFFAAAGILLPFAARVKRRRSLLFGTALGSIFLFLCAIFILLPLCACARVQSEPLPMLSLCKTVHPLLYKVYALLLLLGMFGAALSRLFALSALFSRPGKNHRLGKAAVPALFSLCGFFGALIGFESLLSLLYPLFGIVGFAAFLSFLIQTPLTRKAPVKA